MKTSKGLVNMNPNTVISVLAGTMGFDTCVPVLVHTFTSHVIMEEGLSLSSSHLSTEDSTCSHG